MLRVLLVVALLATFAPSARAVECRASSGSPTVLTDEAVRTRLDFLRAHLTAESSRARRWSLGWTIGFSALAVGQLALVPVARQSEASFLNRDSQPDLLIGAGASLVGLSTLFLNRLSVAGDGPTFAARLGTADPCALLAEGEAMLARSAATEAAGTGALLHVGNAAFNVGLGLVLGLFFKRWQTAVINTLVGTAIGELKILTQPTGSIDAWRRYQAGELPPTVQTVTVDVLPTPAGLTLAGSF